MTEKGLVMPRESGASSTPRRRFCRRASRLLDRPFSRTMTAQGTDHETAARDRTYSLRRDRRHRHERHRRGVVQSPLYPAGLRCFPEPPCPPPPPPAPPPHPPPPNRKPPPRPPASAAARA